MIISYANLAASDRLGQHCSMENNESPCRVLVVDDDKIVRDYIKSLLTSLGAVVVGEAENGDDAVRAFIEFNPDLTFLDIQMPVKNGKDALEEILDNDSSAHVVMLTSVVDMAIADACIELGALSFIRKQAASNILRIMVKAQLDSFKSD